MLEIKERCAEKMKKSLSEKFKGCWSLIKKAPETKKGLSLSWKLASDLKKIKRRHWSWRELSGIKNLDFKILKSRHQDFDLKNFALIKILGAIFLRYPLFNISVGRIFNIKLFFGERFYQDFRRDHFLSFSLYLFFYFLDHTFYFFAHFQKYRDQSSCQNLKISL